jgi:transcriptional regulator with XRE-family HTH domain
MRGKHSQGPSSRPRPRDPSTPRRTRHLPGDLALQLGYDQGWISHIENGRTNPAYGTVDRLARALAWPLSRLVILAESVETDDRKPLDRLLRDIGSNV